MNIQGIYAAVAATDMAASEAFYTELFGRGPDDRPMGSPIQWRDVAGANVQVFLKPEHAGHSQATIVVPDMDAARASLAAAGLSTTEPHAGEFGRIATITDPAGNVITLAKPPPGHAD